jgi:beta-lactamase superfamily II metal-dependent hydrolase
VAVKIHFLNVGHGDCTIVEFPSGNLTVVDINVCPELLAEELISMAIPLGFDSSSLRSRPEWSLDLLTARFKEAAGLHALTNPVDYLVANFPEQSVFRFIATHPHMDHLSGLTDLIRCKPPLNMWHVADGITIDDFDTSLYRLEDWEAYQNAITSPSSPKAISPNSGQLNHFWQQDGIEIWSPSLSLEKQAVEEGNANLASYVLCIRYDNALAVLGGDADEAAWEDIAQSLGDFPKVTVLKASHHGRKTGYHQPSVKAMSPDLTVVSVGKKPPNDASQLYAQYSEAVWSTRWHGNIVVALNRDGSYYPTSDRTQHEESAAKEARLLFVKSYIKALLRRPALPRSR